MNKRNGFAIKCHEFEDIVEHCDDSFPITVVSNGTKMTQESVKANLERLRLELLLKAGQGGSWELGAKEASETQHELVSQIREPRSTLSLLASGADLHGCHETVGIRPISADLARTNRSEHKVSNSWLEHHDVPRVLLEQREGNTRLQQKDDGLQCRLPHVGEVERLAEFARHDL